MTPRSAAPRAVVLVSGGGTNLQAMIDAVARDELALQLVGVVSDRPGVLALDRARVAGIGAWTIDYRTSRDRAAFTSELAATLARLAPDVVVLAGFMRILPAELVDHYRGRMLNVHPSLLPKFPGLDTYRRALAAGECWHGSTVHFVIPALDAGPAVLQYRVAIHPDDTEDSLRGRVQHGEYLIYPRALQWFASGRLAWCDGGPWLDGAPLAAPVVVDEGRPIP